MEMEMDTGSPVRRNLSLSRRVCPTFTLPAALLSRSLLTRHLLSAALPQGQLHDHDYTALHPGTLRGTHGTPLVDPTRPAQVDGSSSTHIPQGALETDRICVLTPDSGHTPPLGSRFKLDCTTLPAHAMSVPALAILFPPTPSLPSFTPFPVPSFPPWSLSSLGPLLPRTTPPFPVV
ncbi:hypothetical protein B0H14DRAFT_3481296 [Mycena olivaceomarginata]|nr:hypothetical protein B0H14DRAFT_3481296 [Mycena olivaceomarginata]